MLFFTTDGQLKIESNIICHSSSEDKIEKSMFSTSGNEGYIPAKTSPSNLAHKLNNRA